jgi:hypothetical protein
MPSLARFLFHRTWQRVATWWFYQVNRKRRLRSM